MLKIHWQSMTIKKRGIKLQIYILLTENCNLNCSMCIRGKQRGRYIDIEKLKRVMETNDFSEHDVVITGGEPTLHKELVNIVKMMSANSKTVTITSNGTFDNFVDELVTCENLFYQISLDGDMDTHNKIRGADSFEKTWRTIKKLDKLNMKYSIASVVSKKNRIDILNLLPVLEQLKNMRYWRISYEMPFGNAGFDNMMRADEWNDFVSEVISKANFRLKIQKIFPFELYDRKREELIKASKSRFRSLNCGSGKNKIYVYPDLRVYPCTCLTDFCVGDLNKQLLEEILNSERIKKFSEYELLKDSECQICEYKEFCNGGCIGMSYHYFGKLGMGDKRCPKLEGVK